MYYINHLPYIPKLLFSPFYGERLPTLERGIKLLNDVGNCFERPWCDLECITHFPGTIEDKSRTNYVNSFNLQLGEECHIRWLNKCITH